jgi:hypothetical protein
MSRSRLSQLIAISILALFSASCNSGSGSATVFEVKIENLSNGPIGTGSNGVPVFSILSPGVFLVHSMTNPAYSLGLPLAPNGFEAFAEDSDFSPFLDFVRFADGVNLIGIFDDLGMENSGFLGPQETFRFVLSAANNDDKLSVFLKYLESNDVILGTSSEGIALFDGNGNPISGDITSQFSFIDVGTEVNEEPGVGPNQPLRQPELNTGPSEGGVVRLVDDGFSYPATSTFRVTISPIADVETP